MLRAAGGLLAALACACEGSLYYPPPSCRIHQRCAARYPQPPINAGTATTDRCGDNFTNVTALVIDQTITSTAFIPNDDPTAVQVPYPQSEWLGQVVSGPSCYGTASAETPVPTPLAVDGAAQAYETFGQLHCLMEMCDDGNNVDGDGCSSNCQLEGVTYSYTYDETLATAADPAQLYLQYTADFSAHTDNWECLYPAESNLSKWRPYYYNYFDNTAGTDASGATVVRYGYSWGQQQDADATTGDIPMPNYDDYPYLVNYTTCCYPRGCGNGIINCAYNDSHGVYHDEEECDDGNSNDGDGCSSSCKIEIGWNCFGGKDIVEEPTHCVQEPSFLTPIEEVAFLVEWYNHTSGWSAKGGWDGAIAAATSVTRVSCDVLKKDGANVTCQDMCNLWHVAGRTYTSASTVDDISYCGPDHFDAVELAYGFLDAASMVNNQTMGLLESDLRQYLLADSALASQLSGLSVSIIGNRMISTTLCTDLSCEAAGTTAAFTVFDFNITVPNAADVVVAINSTLTDSQLDDIFAARMPTLGSYNVYNGGNRFGINVTCNQDPGMPFVSYHKAMCDTCCPKSCMNLTAQLQVAKGLSNGAMQQDIDAYNETCRGYNGSSVGAGNITLCPTGYTTFNNTVQGGGDSPDCPTLYSYALAGSHVEVRSVNYSRVSDPCGYCRSDQTCPKWDGLTCNGCFINASDSGATLVAYSGADCFSTSMTTDASMSVHVPPHTCHVWGAGYVRVFCKQSPLFATRCSAGCEVRFYNDSACNSLVSLMSDFGRPHCAADPVNGGAYVSVACGYALGQANRVAADCSTVHRVFHSPALATTRPSTAVGSVSITSLDLPNNGITGAVLLHSDPVHMAPEQLRSLSSLSRLTHLDLRNDGLQTPNHIGHLTFDEPALLTQLPGCGTMPKTSAASCADCPPSSIFVPSEGTCSFCNASGARVPEADVGLQSPRATWCIGDDELLPLLRNIDVSYSSLTNTDWFAAIRRMSSLLSLRAQNNHLSGTIVPDAFASAQCQADVSSAECKMPRALHLMQIQSNLLTGEIPRSLSAMSSLTDLLWHSNRWSSVGAFSPPSPLRSISLVNSRMQGTLPPTLFTCPSTASAAIGGCSLVELDLSDNMISGTLPDTVGNIDTVTTLSLANNRVSGTLPETLGRLTGLRALDLRKNGLAGVLPLSIQYMTSLEHLDLSDNQLIVRTHTQLLFGFLDRVKHLNLSANAFTSIDPSIGEMDMLEVLDVSRNSLTVIPASVSMLTRLKSLSAAHTLVGVMPDLTLMSALRVADFRNCSLAGLLDQDPQDTAVKRLLFNNPELEELYLQDNALSSTLPPSWSMLSSLRVFNASSNSLTRLPTDLGLLTNLRTWVMNENLLDTTLPSSLAQLTQIVTLQLRGRMGSTQIGLRGTLPSQMGTLPHIQFVDFSHNELSGTLPTDWVAMPALAHLDVSDNHVSGTISPVWMTLPGHFRLDLSENVLVGSLPATIANVVFNLNLNNAGGTSPGGFSCPLPGGELGSAPTDSGVPSITDQVYCSQCQSDSSANPQISCSGADACVTCSSRGVCNGGRQGSCVCQQGWTGAGCQDLVCPSNCSYGVLNEFNEGAGSHGSCVNRVVQLRCNALSDINFLPLDVAHVRSYPASHTSHQTAFANSNAHHQVDTACKAISNASSDVCQQQPPGIDNSTCFGVDVQLASCACSGSWTGMNCSVMPPPNYSPTPNAWAWAAAPRVATPLPIALAAVSAAMGLMTRM